MRSRMGTINNKTTSRVLRGSGFQGSQWIDARLAQASSETRESRRRLKKVLPISDRRASWNPEASSTSVKKPMKVFKTRSERKEDPQSFILGDRTKRVRPTKASPLLRAKLASMVVSATDITTPSIEVEKPSTMNTREEFLGNAFVGYPESFDHVPLTLDIQLRISCYKKMDKIFNYQDELRVLHDDNNMFILT